jgi:hypothetical protein
MSKDSSLNSRREFLKKLDLVHLNGAEFQLLRERKLDKNSMLWAVQHLSECRKCCRLAPKQEIKDALAGTHYGKPILSSKPLIITFRHLETEIKFLPFLRQSSAASTVGDSCFSSLIRRL